MNKKELNKFIENEISKVFHPNDNKLHTAFENGMLCAFQIILDYLK